MFDIVASSQTTNEQSRLNFPVLLCVETLQTLVVSSVAIFSGSLNISCAVLLSSKSVAAMSDDATANAILPIDLTLANSKMIKNVFPVPTRASRKNIFPSFLSIDDNNASYTFFGRCSCDVHLGLQLATVLIGHRTFPLCIRHWSNPSLLYYLASAIQNP